MGTTTKNVTARLAEYALQLGFDDVPNSVVERTKSLLLDFLGVAAGGRSVAESTGPIIGGVRALCDGARGVSTVLGESIRYPEHYAALINATLAHSMDFDDTHGGAIMHIGAPLFATLLALGERADVTGRGFLEAAVVGYDLAGKLGKAHGSVLHDRGFHPTATTGVFFCTAAGARLVGLTTDQTLNALGLNVSQASGSQQFLVNGSWNKRLHTGLAAHNAILSLKMAEHGFFGASEPIEGRFGYFAIYADRRRDAEVALDGLGSEFEVMNTAVKPYPCCRFSHGVIDAITSLKEQHKIAAADITAIDIELGATAYGIVAEPPEMKRCPSNLVEGQFSVFFAAAATVLDKYTWESYRLIEDPGARQIMDRTSVAVNPQLSGMQSRTVVRTKDGSCLEREVLSPKGEPENPLSWEETVGKFSAWGEEVFGLNQTRKVVALVSRLEELSTISDLTSCLRGEQ